MRWFVLSQIGRPKSDNPKNIKMNIRISNDTLKDLNFCSETLKVSKINVIEKGIELVKRQIEDK